MIDPLRQLLQLLRGDDKGHAIEPLLKLILGRVGFVVDQILLILILFVAVLVYLRHHHQFLGVLQIEPKHGS